MCLHKNGYLMTKQKKESMRAVVFDGTLKVVMDYHVPALRQGWARIRIIRAGICKTDMEIMKGYKGFTGVLGHEFIGVVEACDEPVWLGKRVVADINIGCGKCSMCAQGLSRHCAHRAALGILNHDGCMADFCVLPVSNLLEVPAEISDDRAVMNEPLSAACEIIAQLPFEGTERVIVLGDGRLGILCAWVLSTVVLDVTIAGHHPEKLETAKWRAIRTALNAEGVEPGADVVVEASGSEKGIAEAIRLCRPRGTIILKSTVASQGSVNLTPVVVNEISIIGSRCGLSADGMDMLKKYPDMAVEKLITGRYPIEEAVKAFERAAGKEALKVLIEIN